MRQLDKETSRVSNSDTVGEGWGEGHLQGAQPAYPLLEGILPGSVFERVCTRKSASVCACEHL